MEIFVFVFITAFAVSLDSFFAGFSKGIKGERSIKLPIVVSVVTFLLCSLSVLLGSYFSAILQSFVTPLGCALLVLAGLTNFMKKDVGTPQTSNMKESLIVAIAVGMDAAIANLSLALMGYTSFLIPIFFTAMHFLMVGAGLLSGGSKIIPKLKCGNIIAGIVLILLGLSKLL